MAWFSATNETMAGGVYEDLELVSSAPLEVKNLLDARRAVIELTKSIVVQASNTIVARTADELIRN